MNPEEAEVKPCPFCGQQPLNLSANLMCQTRGCPIESKPILRGQWNTRPDLEREKLWRIWEMLGGNKRETEEAGISSPPDIEERIQALQEYCLALSALRECLKEFEKLEVTPKDIEVLRKANTDLAQENFEYRQRMEELKRLTPKRPNAITWERGVEILNYVQDKLLPFWESLSRASGADTKKEKTDEGT